METINYEKTWGVEESWNGGWMILADGHRLSSGTVYKVKKNAEKKSFDFITSLHKPFVDFLGHQVTFTFTRKDA